MHGQVLTEGNIRRQLWSLAWPMMLSIFFYTLYNLVDAYWVSKISAEAIAAVSISQITLFVMISLGFGITAGSGVLMAMHIGAQDRAGAERILGQSLVLTAILGVVFTAVALLFRHQLLIASGAGGAIFAPALEYYTVTAAGSILLFIMIAVMFSFNAQGDTNTLTKLFALSTAVNVVLDPVLIFGWWGAPAWGVAGAAVATLISQAVFIGFAIRSLSSPTRSIRFSFHNLTVQWASVKKVLNIGIPASLTQVIFPVGLALLTLITAQRFLEAGAVAFSLGFRIEFFAYLPAVGYGFGAMAMMGQNVGGGNIGRAKTALAQALTYGFLGAAALGVAAALFADPIIRVFTTDPTVTAYARAYLRTVALSYGFLSTLMVEASAFQAIGQSWPGFWIFFLRVFVVSIPLAYLSAQVLQLPIIGVWLAVVAGNVIASVVGYWWITRAMRKLKPSEALARA